MEPAARQSPSRGILQISSWQMSSPAQDTLVQLWPTVAEELRKKENRLGLAEVKPRRRVKIKMEIDILEMMFVQ